MVSDERALAYAGWPNATIALARTFADRGVAASAGWHDFFDAAAGPAGCRIPRPRADPAPARASRPCSPPRRWPPAASELAVLRLALMARRRPFGAVAERVAAA